MAAIVPKRNLSPLAEPWGRTVDNRIATLESGFKKSQQDTGNALSAINATTSKLSDQVAAIEELTTKLAAQQEQLEAQQATLVAQQATLQNQQNTLQSQQAQLSAQVAQIQSVINNQVTGRTATASGSVAASGTNFIDVVQCSIIVPSGYTRAYIMGVGSLEPYDGFYNTLRVRIEGEYGGTTTADSASHARTLTGLTAGDSLQVTVNGNTGGAPTFYGQISAIAIFLK